MAPFSPNVEGLVLSMGILCNSTAASDWGLPVKRISCTCFDKESARVRCIPVGVSEWDSQIFLPELLLHFLKSHSLGRQANLCLHRRSAHD